MVVRTQVLFVPSFLVIPARSIAAVCLAADWMKFMDDCDDDDDDDEQTVTC